ncbi:MAG: aminopeptidase [Planctomycetes bacterium]|nr:aminopeptidase [Planctomycetota bacterium]
MNEYFKFELVKAAMVLATDELNLQVGETIIITADTQTDFQVVDAVAGAAFAVGAKPMVITLATPLGVGKAADPMLPVESLTAALSKADVWVEFNQQWLLYSTPYEQAMRENKKLRYVCLVGMNADLMIRLISRVNIPLLSQFLHKVTDMTQSARDMRITTKAGNDLTFKLLPEERIVLCDDGLARVSGAHFLSGQICFFPEYASIHGRLVFDGTIAPPCGFLNETVLLDIEGGCVMQISGGKKADELRYWLESFNDPNMFRLAHGCYGFHPGAKLTGNVIEDERVWGCTEWGIGYVSPNDAPPEGIPAKSHCDGICLNSSVWLDGVQILEKGKVIHPELKPLADALVSS